MRYVVGKATANPGDSGRWIVYDKQCGEILEHHKTREEARVSARDLNWTQKKQEAANV